MIMVMMKRVFVVVVVFVILLSICVYLERERETGNGSEQRLEAHSNFRFLQFSIKSLVLDGVGAHPSSPISEHAQLRLSERIQTACKRDREK